MGDREPEGAFEGDVSAGAAAVDSADSEESRKMKRVDDSKDMLPDIHISFDKQSSNKVRASEKMTIVKKPLQETETTEKGSSEDVLKGAEEKGYIKERAVPTGVPVVGSLGQGMDAANNKERPAPLKAMDTKKTKPEGTMITPDVAAAAVAGRKPEERKEQGTREEGIVRKGTEVKQDQDEGKEAKPQVADIRGLAPRAGVHMAAAAVVPKEGKPDSAKKVAEPAEGALAQSVKPQETKQKAGIPAEAAPAAVAAVVATAEKKPQGKQEKGGQEEGIGPKDTKAPGAAGKETVPSGDRKRGTPEPSVGPVIAQQSGAFVQEVTAVPAGAAVVEAMDKDSLPEPAVATKAKPQSAEGISASKAGDTTPSSAVALDGKPQNVEGVYGAAAMGGDGVVEVVARSMEPKEGASKLGHEDTITPSKPALDSTNTGPNPEEGEALLPKKARPAAGGFGLGLGTIRSFFMGGWGSVKQRTGDDVAESAGKAVEGETSPKQISEAIEEEGLVQQGGTAVGSKEVSTGSVPIMGTVDDVADSSGAPNPIEVASGEGKTLKPAAVEVLSATTRELPISTVKSVDSEGASRGKDAPMSIGGSGEIREVVPDGSASRSLRVIEVSPAAPVAMSESIARDPSSGEGAMRGPSGPAEETAVEERRVVQKTTQRIGKKASGGVMGVIAFVFGEPDDATDGDDLGVGTSNFEKKQTWLWHSS